MQVPLGFHQVTHILDGLATPHGGAVVFGVSAAVVEDPISVAEKCVAAWVATVKASLTDSCHSSLTIVKVGSNTEGPSVVTAAPFGGASGSASTPPNTAALFKKNTIEGGRKNRGRSFWPGVAESDVNASGQMIGASFDAFAGRVEDYFDALVAEDVPMYILHNDSSAPTEVTSLVLDPRVATQRRRLRS